MQSVLRTLQLAVILGAFVGAHVTPVSVYAQLDAHADLAMRINRERTLRGMIPYASSAVLNAAAQAHADDIAHTGVNSHTGSDGSTVSDRVKRAGYSAYSWGYRVGENWAYYFDAATAMQMWMNSAPHTHNILHPIYREFGIGIARAQNGAIIFVVDFGAQPNVLPIFILNDSRDNGRVTIALSNENYATNGDGELTIGLATQVSLASSSDFAGARWQPYAARIEWTLNGGAKTIFVKFRDVRGRTTVTSDSLVIGAAAAAKPTTTNTPRPRPSATRSIFPTLASNAEPSETPAPTLIVALEPTATLELPLARLETPAPLPPNSVESDDPREENQMNVPAFAVLGVGLLVGIFAVYKFISVRSNK